MKRQAAVPKQVAIEWPSLTRIAREASARSHVPYSRVGSGAAVLAGSGRSYAGCKVENSSLGLALCAERGAIAEAVAAGERQIVATLIVVAGKPLPPCGACRQVLAEFGAPAMPIVVIGGRAARKAYTLGHLLPVK